MELHRINACFMGFPIAACTKTVCACRAGPTHVLLVVADHLYERTQEYRPIRFMKYLAARLGVEVT